LTHHDLIVTTGLLLMLSELTDRDLIIIGLLLVLCVIVVRWQLRLVRAFREEIEKQKGCPTCGGWCGQCGDDPEEKDQ